MSLEHRVRRLEAATAGVDVVYEWLDAALAHASVVGYHRAHDGTGDPPAELIRDGVVHRFGLRPPASVAAVRRFGRELVRALMLYALATQLLLDGDEQGPLAYQTTAHLHLRLEQLRADPDEHDRVGTWIPAATAHVTRQRAEAAIRRRLEERYFGGRELRFAAARETAAATRFELWQLTRSLTHLDIAGVAPAPATVRSEVQWRVEAARAEGRRLVALTGHAAPPAPRPGVRRNR